MKIERGRYNNKKIFDLTQDFKVDIDYPRLLTRSKSLNVQKIKNLFKSFDIIQEENSEEDRDFKKHLTCIHKTKAYNDFYKIHHRNSLPIDRINRNEDLVTSEYFKSIFSNKTKMSTGSPTTYEESAKVKDEEKINDNKSHPVSAKKTNYEGIEDIKEESTNQDFSEKTNNNNSCRNKFDYDLIEVIKEDLNENEKTEES